MDEGSGQRLGGLCRALHVVWRRLQGGRRSRGALKDVARQEETGGDGGLAGLAGRGLLESRVRQGRAGPDGVGTCRCDGNVVAIVSE